MDRKIAVSIIISVYNTEKYLRKCLDSLVRQTLTEIEIIAVNNGSTDGCTDILRDYSKQYSGLINVITIKENTGDPAIPWNMGIDAARGEYISIVDSDDWCDTAMFELLYKAAKKYKSEMVLCDHYEVYGKNLKYRGKINAVPGEFDLKQLMMYPHMAPWGKIIERQIFLDRKLKYVSQIHCDTGLNLILYSYLHRVSYVDEPLYYYNRINPSSETNTKKRMRQAEITGTLDHILENYNTEWEDEVVFSVVKFLYWFCFVEYVYHQDIFWPFIKDHEAEIRRNKYIRRNRDNLRSVLDRFDDKLVPKRIVYSTFGKKALSKLEQHCINSWKEYTSGYEFVELNESTCDIEENDYIHSKVEAGEYELVSDYFIAKELFENGGIALRTNMAMNGPIGELRTHAVTVGYDALHTIGDGVIAAIPKAPITRLLYEYIMGQFEPLDPAGDPDDDDYFWEDQADETEMSLVQKFFKEYYADHNLTLSNRNEILPGDISVLSSDRLYYEISDVNIFYRQYEETYNVCEDPFVILHKNAIDCFLNNIRHLESQHKVISQELYNIKNSRSWRYMEPARRFFRFLRGLRAKLHLGSGENI